MRHDFRWLRIATALPVCVVLLCATSISAQQVVEANAAGDAADRDPAARVWDAATSKDVITLKGHTNGVVSAAFFPDGERVLTGSGDRSARVWDARSGEGLLTIAETDANSGWAALSADGSRILTTNIPTVKIWDAKTGRELLNLTHDVGLEMHWPFSYRGSFSPDGKQVAIASPVFKLSLRDAKTGDEQVALKGLGYWPNFSAFSPDGSKLASGCQTADDVARVWDTQTAVELLALKGHGGSVWSVCFSPDGKRIATGGVNGKVRIWDLKDGAELLTLGGHGKVITAIAFSPDGKRIVTGSQDNTGRIWDAEKGTELIVLKGHSHMLMDARFSPDGKRIVTASWDKTALIWDFQRYLDAVPRDTDSPPQPK